MTVRCFLVIPHLDFDGLSLTVRNGERVLLVISNACEKSRFGRDFSFTLEMTGGSFDIWDVCKKS